MYRNNKPATEKNPNRKLITKTDSVSKNSLKALKQGTRTF